MLLPLQAPSTTAALWHNSLQSSHSQFNADAGKLSFFLEKSDRQYFLIISCDYIGNCDPLEKEVTTADDWTPLIVQLCRPRTMLDVSFFQISSRMELIWDSPSSPAISITLRPKRESKRVHMFAFDASSWSPRADVHRS